MSDRIARICTRWSTTFRQATCRDRFLVACVTASGPSKRSAFSAGDPPQLPRCGLNRSNLCTRP
jgi:hypothetical protein